MKRKFLLLLTCMLFLGTSQGLAQRDQSSDPYAKDNARLEKWAKDLRGVKLKMEMITFGDLKIEGLKAIYRGEFKIGNAEWEIRRYARPGYGDYLDLGKIDKNGEYFRLERVIGPKSGIREVDVSVLLKKLPSK